MYPQEGVQTKKFSARSIVLYLQNAANDCDGYLTSKFLLS